MCLNTIKTQEKTRAAGLDRRVPRVCPDGLPTAGKPSARPRSSDQGGDMLAAAAAGASHPAVAALLGLGAAGLAGVVVAMAWSVNTRQIRLAGQLARRQFTVTADMGRPDPVANGHVAALKETAASGAQAAAGGPRAAAGGTRVTAAGGARAAAPGAGAAPSVVIDGPETVITGEQARYRVLPASSHQMVTWAVGGGAVAQTPDPARPDELLLIADQPGDLTIIARVREGMTEHRATKPVSAVADVTPPVPPFPLRLFLHGWGLVVAAILIVGFAGALDALGNLTSSEFIALAALLAALLGVTAVARGMGDTSGPHGHGIPRP
jgi:hypothetical protein